MRFVAGMIVMLAVASGCEKKKPSAPPPRPETVAADGTRSIPVDVGDGGYQPSKIRARAGEKVELVFTRHTKSECGAQVKVGDGPPVDLPLEQPVKVAVAVPPSGEVHFACGMDMMSGVIMVQ